MLPRKNILFAVLILAGAPVALSQPLVRVPVDADLQQAIDRVSDGGVIEIAAGTYPAPQNGFSIRRERKSFTVRAAAGADVVLDGEGSHPVLRIEDNGADRGRQIVIERLTLANGHSTTEAAGGGLTVISANVLVVDALFRDNRSEAPTTGGGAVRISSASKVRFEETDFRDNSARNRGGAIEVVSSPVEISGGTFSGNTGGASSFGGAIFGSSATVDVDGATFDDNEAGLEGGAVFLIESTATFTDSVFTGNTATRSGGGLASVSLAPLIGDSPDPHLEISGSTFAGNHCDSNGGALVISNRSLAVRATLFAGNTAGGRGGAIRVSEGFALLSGSEFMSNRVNLEGHLASASGGALDIHDSIVEVTGSRFEANEAAAVGGAIVLVGPWNDPETEPTARLSVRTSSSLSNRLAVDPCCEGSVLRRGGAIAVFDQARLEVYGAQFTRNRANVGGAVYGYRSEIDIQQSIFRGNVAEETDLIGGTGGSVTVGSIDLPDASTELGDRNRPTSRLTVANTLFQGSFGSVTDTANFGGCLFIEGDVNALFGEGGMKQDGTDADNRAVAVLDHVTLVDCSTTEDVNGDSLGGAIGANIVDLTIRGSLVANSHARGDGGLGGGLLVFSPSRVAVSDTTFAFNSSERAAGMAILGSELQVEDVAFFENEVSPGRREPVTSSQGAAIFTAPAFSTTSPHKNRDATGVVESSIFVGNIGIPLYEEDRSSGTINRTQYNDNRFRETSFGSGVFFNGVAGFSARSVAQLNSLLIARSGGPSTDKSTVPNVQLQSAPDLGTLVAASSVVFPNPPPGEPEPREAFLGYAWRGTGARLDGVDLPGRSGVLAVSQPGEYELSVDGVVLDRATVEKDSLCSGGEQALCLDGERFQVEVEWRDFQDRTGSARVVPFGSNDSGLFYFFDPDNWEMLVKIVDGCGLNQHFWVFAAATTNVEYTLRVTDTLSGATKSYFNGLGVSAPAVTDTQAFATCDAASVAAGTALRVRRPVRVDSLRERTTDSRGGSSPCVPGAESMCLNRDRFRVEVEWRDFQNRTGAAEVVPFGSDDSGLFFFFDPDNWEMLVKVIDGCGLNQQFWVFAAATTNVEYTLRVTDSQTGATREYFNPLGQASPAITDTQAFATCPSP